MAGLDMGYTQATKFLTSVVVLMFGNAGTWGVWLTVEPPNVLLLLLVVYVVRDEERKASVNSTLLQVLFKENLEVLVEVIERRALLKLDVVKNSEEASTYGVQRAP